MITFNHRFWLTLIILGCYNDIQSPFTKSLLDWMMRGTQPWWCRTGSWSWSPAPLPTMPCNPMVILLDGTASSNAHVLSKIFFYPFAAFVSKINSFSKKFHLPSTCASLNVLPPEKYHDTMKVVKLQKS